MTAIATDSGLTDRPCDHCAVTEGRSLEQGAGASCLGQLRWRDQLLGWLNLLSGASGRGVALAGTLH